MMRHCVVAHIECVDLCVKSGSGVGVSVPIECEDS